MEYIQDKHRNRKKVIYYFPDTRPSTWSKRKTNQKSKPKILPDIFKKLVHFSNKFFLGCIHYSEPTKLDLWGLA